MTSLVSFDMPERAGSALIVPTEMISHCIVKKITNDLWFGECYFKHGLYENTKMGGILTTRINSMSIGNPAWSTRDAAMTGVTQTLDAKNVCIPLKKVENDKDGIRFVD